MQVRWKFENKFTSAWFASYEDLKRDAVDRFIEADPGLLGLIPREDLFDFLAEVGLEIECIAKSVPAR